MRKNVFFSTVFFLTVVQHVATASTGINQVVVNTDRSVAIHNPHFSVGGRATPVSVDSDLEGVCSLLGFTKPIADGVLSSKEDEDTVVLNRIGQFKGFAHGRKIETLLCDFYPVVKCAHVNSSQEFTKSRHRKGVRFIEKTVTCHNPWVGSELYGYPLVYTQEIDLCSQLEYADSKSTNSLSSKSVQLDANRRFFGFETNVNVFSYITCHYQHRVL